MRDENKVSGKPSYRQRVRPAGSLLDQTRGRLHRLGLRARKGLGQHFLIDEDVLGKIIAAAELTADDFVLEVGPGLGVLTRELAARAGRVVAVELDDTLAALLNQSLASFHNITIINQDILTVDMAALLAPSNVSYKVVANLPYYITSPVLRHFLEAPVKPEMMVVMVQKEVAAEIAAKPGRMSLLSVGIQLYGQPAVLEHVPARSFYPAPQVDSALLKITPYPRPAVEVDDSEGFFVVVRAGFSAARKQLVNSLAQGLEIPKAEALSLLEKAAIAPQRRAETLTLEEWAHLWRIFARRGASAC